MHATRAWMILVALSAGSTLLALSGQAGVIISLAILALAWIKALVILRNYLGLGAAPAWLHGFALVMAGYMVLAMVLVAIAETS